MSSKKIVSSEKDDCNSPLPHLSRTRLYSVFGRCPRSVPNGEARKGGTHMQDMQELLEKLASLREYL